MSRSMIKSIDPSKKKALTFFSKKESECPVCSHVSFHEDLRSGRGRIIAGDVTDELHCQFVPSAKHGSIHPLIYPIHVCPNCFFAAFKRDFERPSDETVKQLNEKTIERKQMLNDLVENVDFTEYRGLTEGLGSYLLAMFSYDSFPDAASPVFKQGLCALRAGWLCLYVHKAIPGQQYAYLHRHCMRKAAFLYGYSLELEQKKKQIIPLDFFLGPDVDRDYSYDGVVYLDGLLEYRYGSKEDLKLRLKRLTQKRNNVGRMFGFGRSSKEKPSAILNYARDLYEALSDEVQLLSVSS